MSDILQRLRRKMFHLESSINTARQSIDEQAYLIQQVVAGEINHTADNHTMIAAALENVSHAYRLIEQIGDQNFPESFWKKPEGKLLAKGYMWLLGDDLITLKEGACVLFDIMPSQYTLENKWRIALNTLTCGRYGKPSLRTYYDPTPGVRYPMRLSRNEVVEFKKTYRHKKK